MVLLRGCELPARAAGDEAVAVANGQVLPLVVLAFAEAFVELRHVSFLRCAMRSLWRMYPLHNPLIQHSNSQGANEKG